MVLLGGLIEISFSVISENNTMYGDTSLMALALEGLFRYLRRMCDDLRTTTEGVVVKIRVGTKSLEQLYEEDPRLLEVQGSGIGESFTSNATNTASSTGTCPIRGDFAFVAKHFV